MLTVSLLPSFGTGKCFGWSCKCLSNKDATLAPELAELDD